MKSFGYVRVSTTTQSLDRQVDALVAAGIADGDIRSDKITGTRQSRPGLDELLRTVREGDSITVHSLDRLGRSALHVFQTIADLEGRGISVKSLKEGEAHLTGATGDFMRKLMILVAELERNMNQERVAEARASRAKRLPEGEQLAGRPRTATTATNVRKVQDLRSKGISIPDIVAATGMSRASVYRALSK